MALVGTYTKAVQKLANPTTLCNFQNPFMILLVNEFMNEDMEKEGKEVPFVKKSKESVPVEEVPRTNTGVKIDNPEEMEEAGAEK